MNGKGKTIKLSVMLILMIALMFSTAFMMIIKATEDTKDGEDAKYDGQYTIQYLISHYNLVTLNDVDKVEHIVGPVLIGGNIKTKLYHSQVTRNVSSYVKGTIAKDGNVNPTDHTSPTLYLGTKANAKVNEGGKGANVNDQWYTNNPTVITDTYLDFNKLFDSIRNQSKNLEVGEKAKVKEDKAIDIKIGKTVTISDLKDVTYINLIGDVSDNKTTLINISGTGTVTMPELRINGEQAHSDEQSSTGNAIVWNFPNATNIKMASSPFVGHIVAPSADIEAPDTNFAGCMITKSLSGHIEGHFYTYSGTKIPLNEVPKEEPKEEPKDKNNTTASKNNTTGNSTTASKNNTTKPSNNTTGNSTTESKNNTTKPKNNTTGNSTTESKNNTTKPKNNTTGNSTTESKNNTTKPKNNTTGNSTTASKNNTTKTKNNTTKKNVAVANKANKTNTSKNEDGMVLGAEWEKNNTSKNKTDKTTADGKLPQTGDEFSQKIVLGVVMIALVVVFGVKYVKHKNELDANK